MEQPTDILIIRHGQTAWNQLKRLQGHSDIPLNEKGRLQAAILAETLRDEHLDAIFSSDLQRASETAKAIAKKHRLPVYTDQSFRERCYGICEGMTDGEIKNAYPESYKAWYAADPDHFFPDGKRKTESPRQFYHRAIKAIGAVALRHPGQKIAIVTHFGIIESAYRAAKKIPLSTPCPLPVLNTSINRFRWVDNTIELVQWGEDTHLEEAKNPPVDYYKHY